MDIQITGKNLDLSAANREYITRKLDKVQRHLKKIEAFEVVVTEESTRSPNQRFVVQVTVQNKGTILRGEERGVDLYNAIDNVAEVMNRQVEHYKGKQPDSNNRGKPSIRTTTSEVTTPEVEEPIDEGPRIVKTKRFDVKPMAIDEAVDQMILLRHDFFLFHNTDTNNVNLLYKRKDGDLGLIVTNK
jgi:putative sigma-54 modulation protein